MTVPPSALGLPPTEVCSMFRLPLKVLAPDRTRLPRPVLNRLRLPKMPSVIPPENVTVWLGSITKSVRLADSVARLVKFRLFGPKKITLLSREIRLGIVQV